MPFINANVDYFLDEVDQEEATANCDFGKGLCSHIKAFEILPHLKCHRKEVLNFGTGSGSGSRPEC